jgi:TonB family protein
VILDTTISPCGNMTSVRVLGGHPQLAEAAVEAVRQWRYAPTVVNGRAVPIAMTVTMRFSLAPRDVQRSGASGKR